MTAAFGGEWSGGDKPSVRHLITAHPSTLGVVDVSAIMGAWLAIVFWSGHAFGNRELVALGAIILVQLVIGSLLHLYQGRFRIGSAAELRTQGFAGIIVITLGVAAATALDLHAGPGWILLFGLSAFGLMVLARQGLRMRIDDQRRSYGIEPVIVVGAGNLAERLIARMLGDPSGRYLPVAVLDDDESKIQTTIGGVRVVGRLEDASDFVELLGAGNVIVASETVTAAETDELIASLDLSTAWVHVIAVSERASVTNGPGDEPAGFDLRSMNDSERTPND